MRYPGAVAAEAVAGGRQSYLAAAAVVKPTRNSEQRGRVANSAI